VPAFLLAVFLLCVSAASAAALVRRGLVSFLLAFYVLAVGEIVVLTELLSLVHGVRTLGYLIGEAVLAALALAVWSAYGRPLPALPRLDLRGALRRHPILAALAVVVGCGLAYETFLVLTLPPSTWDAMTYHLPRAAGWLQAHAVEYLPAHTTRENVLPPNAEIQILWTFATLGTDALAALPQLVAELVLVVAIYGCARRLRFDRPGATFAALLFATLTGVALQATSTQNDLAVAAPVAVSAYFLLGRTNVELALAGAAAGLALGTKLTALPALPFLGLLALAVVPRARLPFAAAAAVAGAVVLGGYGYALNLADSGSPLGDSQESAEFSPDVTFGGTVSTFARTYWDFIDLSGLDPGFEAQQVFQDAGPRIFSRFGIDPSAPESSKSTFWFGPNIHVDEDISWFGPLGALLIVPLSLGFAIAFVVRRTSRARLVFALSLPLFVVGVALTHRYNVWMGRFMIVPVALVMPLAAWLYPLRLLATGTTLLATVVLFVAHSDNKNKPFDDALWNADRITALTAKRGDLRPALRWIEEHVPDDAAVGVRLGPDDWAYPLYGPRLARRVVPVRSLDDAGALRWVVVSDTETLPLRPGWRETRFAGTWRVLTR
jgi:hypothetical protein